MTTNKPLRPPTAPNTDDVLLIPDTPMNIAGALATETIAAAIKPHDLDFYDDEEWALSVGKPWHAYRCTHDYFRHPNPVQTGDCQNEVTP